MDLRSSGGACTRGVARGRGFGVVNSALGLPMIQWPVEGERHKLERSVDELLRMGPAATVDNGCFDTPGDNRCVDELFGGKGTLGRLK